MSSNHDSHELWREEMQSFITHWEQETELIKGIDIDTEECSRIAETFHHDCDGLLVRKPVNVLCDPLELRLQEIDRELTRSLAMACSVSRKKP